MKPHWLIGWRQPDPRKGREGKFIQSLTRISTATRDEAFRCFREINPTVEIVSFHESLTQIPEEEYQ